MAYLNIERQFTSQPQYAAPIAGNSLTQGLVKLFTPASGGVVPIGGITPIIGADGVGFRAASNTAYYQANAGKILAGSAQYTVIAGFSTTQTWIAPGRPLYCERAPSGNDILKLECLSFDNFALLTLRDDAGTLIQIKNAVAVNDGRFHVLAGVQYSTSDHRLFVDGVQANSSATTLTNTYTDTIESRIGADAGDSVAAFNDPIYFVGLWNRALTAQEIAQVSSNPWRLFKAPSRKIWIASAGVAGSLATTNANDTLSASGTTAVTGSLAKTNANDTSSASGTTTVTGSLAKTNANDTLNASGAVGSGVTGSLAYTNANDTSAASGTTTVTGSVSRTNANDTSAASGTTTVTGSLVKTNANDTLAASGFAGSVTGTVAVTNADDTVSARGSAGNAVTSFSGGYAYISREDRAELRKKQRIELGIIKEEIKQVADIDKFEISNLSKKKPVLVAASKGADLAEQEALNAELKRLIALQVEREEEEILKILMEL